MFADGDDLAAQCRIDIVFHGLLNLFARVQDGAMITPTEELPDLEERDLGLQAHQVHSDLAWHDDMFVALLAAHILQRDVVVFCYCLGNLSNVEVRLPAVVAERGHGGTCHVNREVRAVQLLIGHEAVQAAFQFTYVRLQVRWLDVGNQSPLETGTQSLFQTDNRLGRAITTDHDLLAHLVQTIEGVEELFLCRFFACDELDIVHQQDIYRAVFGAKFLGRAIADSINNFIGELLRRDVEHCQPGLYALVADSM